MHEADARAAYAELLRLGARPSRTIREHFAYPTINNGGYHSWKDEERGTSHEAHADLLMPHHWQVECQTFTEQLELWNKFREVQTIAKDDQDYRHYLLLTPAELSPLVTENLAVARNLTALRDWRAYRTYQHTKLSYCNRRQATCRDQVISSRQAYLDLADPPQKRDAKSRLNGWISQLKTSHKKWLAEKAISDRLETEMQKMLEEAVSDLSALDPTLLASLEEDAAKTAQVLADRVGDLSGSKWLVRSPASALSMLDKLRHWEQEISRFAELYTDWKENIRWMQECHDPMDDDIVYLLATEPNPIRNRRLWELHVLWRKRQLEKAEKWMRCWKNVEDFCNEEERVRRLLFLPEDYAEKARKEQLASQTQIQAAVAALEIAKAESSEGLYQLDQANIKLPKCPWGVPSEFVDKIVTRKRKAVEDAPMVPPAKRVCLGDEGLTVTGNYGARNKAIASTPRSRNQPDEHADGASASPLYPTPPSTGSPGNASGPAVVQDASPLAASSGLPRPGASNGRRSRRSKNKDHQNLNKNAHVPGAPRYDFRPRTITQKAPTTSQSTRTPPTTTSASEVSEDRASKRVQRSKPSNRSSHGQENGANKLDQRSKPISRSSNGKGMGATKRSQDHQEVDASKLRRSSRVQKQKGRWAPY